MNCKATGVNFKYYVNWSLTRFSYNQYIFPVSSWKIEGVEIKCDLNTSEEKHKRHPQQPRFIV